mgnify:CR=1 FL=1
MNKAFEEVYGEHPPNWYAHCDKCGQIVKMADLWVVPIDDEDDPMIVCSQCEREVSND